MRYSNDAVTEQLAHLTVKSQIFINLDRVAGDLSVAVMWFPKPLVGCFKSGIAVRLDATVQVLGNNVRPRTDGNQLLFFIVQFNPCYGNLVPNSERITSGNKILANAWT